MSKKARSSLRAKTSPRKAHKNKITEEDSNHETKVLELDKERR